MSSTVSEFIVRLEGLPFRVTRDELLEFLEDCNVENDVEGIHLILNREGRASGMGYVELKSMDDVEKAMKMSQKNIGRHNRYANIFHCDSDELAWYLNRKDANVKSEKKYRLKMQGLPFRATEFQVAKWFEPLSHCSDVEVHLNSDGRASGEATAYFDTSSLAEAALKKDRDDMEGRYINITQESGRALARHGYYVRMSGLPFRATEDEMIDFFKPDADCVAARVIYNREGRPSGEAIAEFETDEQAELAIKYKNREHLGNRFVILSREDDVGGGDGFNDNGFDSSGGGDSYRLRMGGLPFRATRKEIQEWFSPEAECVGVKVLLNREGRPSGEALASFETQEEAEKAMAKNKEYMGERFVILTRQY